MPYEKISLNLLKRMKDLVEERMYTRISTLAVEAWITGEPVPYIKRKSGQHLSLSPGDKWGNLWDCAWFHFTGSIPDNPKNKKLVLLIDVNGELCLVDQEGTPLQGLTNVNSEFDYSLGKPGKRVVALEDISINGNEIDLWADAGCNDLFGRYRSGSLKEADIAICHEEVKALYYDIEVLLEMVTHLDMKSIRRAKIMQALYEVSLVLVDWTEENVLQAREILSVPLSKKNGDSELTVSAIGHAHIDLAWLWPIRETIRKGARTFSTVLRNMEKYPDYIFGASQPQLYQWIKDCYPKLYEQVKQRIKEGRWEVQGAMWVEPDSNVPGGEALVRQVLYGKRFFQDEFGKDMEILWVPDIFGYSASLPQILKKSGVDYVMTQKLSWNSYNDYPHHTFYWEGIDGSRVLTHLPPEDTYNSPAAPRSLIKIEQEYYDKNVSENALLLYGIGDGGGGPGEEHLERLKRETNLLGLPPVVQEHSLQFFKKLERQSNKYKVWHGELYLEKHQGTLTTQAGNKRFNRKLEKFLREWEFASSLASLLTGYEYPKEELETIWKEMLLYQFHDILPGSSITRVYKESLERYEVLLHQVMENTETAYRKIAETTGETGTFLFNSLPWERKEWVKVDSQWMEVVIPSMGYQIIQKRTHQNAEFMKLKATSQILENDVLKMVFNEDGTIASLYDKEVRRETIKDKERANLFSLYHDYGDAWDFPTNYYETKAQQPNLFKSEAGEDGPTIWVKHYYKLNKSTIQQTIIMTQGSRRVDFRTVVDWQEKEKMLRTAFPLNVITDTVNSEIQFGYIKRPTHRNTQWDFAKDEISAHHWIDLSEPDYGVTLLNDSKYGHRAFGQSLDINLLRSPSYPDPLADQQTIHEFTYSLYPHSGEFTQAEVYKQGYELNVPIRSINMTEERQGKDARKSFLNLDGKHVMIESVKQAENDQSLIVRLYETSGSHRCSTLNFDFSIEAVYETDLMENAVERVECLNSSVALSFKPFEIKTLKIL